MIGKKFANKIKKKSTQNTLETVECETGIPKKGIISPEERQQSTDELRLI